MRCRSSALGLALAGVWSCGGSSERMGAPDEVGGESGSGAESGSGQGGSQNGGSPGLGGSLASVVRARLAALPVREVSEALVSAGRGSPAVVCDGANAKLGELV